MTKRWPLLAMMHELSRASGPLTGALAVVVLAAGLAPALITIAVGRLIAAMPMAERSTATHHALILLGLVGLLFVMQQLLGPAAAQLGDALGRRLNRRLRDRVVTATLVPDGIGHLERGDLLDLVSGASGVGTTRVTPREALVAAVNVGTLRLQGLCCAAVLAAFHWWLAAALLAVFAALAYGAVYDFRAGVRATTGAPALLRRPNYLRGLALDPAAAKDLRLFGLRCWLDQSFHAEWMRALAGLRTAGERRPWVGPALGAGMLVSQLGVYVLLAIAVTHGTISPGDFVTYAGAVLGVAGMLAASPDNLNISYGTAAIPLVGELEGAVVGSAAEGSFDVVLEKGIRLENITFTYPGRDLPVFERLNLDIWAGQSLAIVGLNGAGKTTLVKLLCRLYEPDEGRILVDGVSLTDIAPAAWRRHVAAVFQDFVRYELTAEENIAFGAWAYADDKEGLIASAELADATEIIERTIGGWDADLSDGKSLSGGQWQRIALARAFFAVRHDAQLLILDEPTAALDARAEAELHARFLAGLTGVTSIIISHRFATVRPADRIVVLKDGRIVEDGDHDALLRAGGEYARMFRLQAESFLEDEVITSEA
jgi:ATP-binding cassette, subfamily B, bacterial